MPGPGSHMIYTLGSGQALMHVSNGRFGPHHCVIYAINSFFGPDMGSFVEWFTSTVGLGRALGSSIEPWIHDPFFYVWIMGIPLTLLYSWASRILLQRGLLDSYSGLVDASASIWEAVLLVVICRIIIALFLDHLFEIYLVIPPRPAVGEEADLGVLIFLGIYFFFPHWLCIVSMNPREFTDSTQLPL